MERNARQIGARRRCEVEAGIGDVIRLTEAAEGNLLEERFTMILRKILGHIGINESGGNAVDRHAAGADFARQGFGHSHEPHS